MREGRVDTSSVSVRNGPEAPRFPLSLIHPLGPLFPRLPILLRRRLLYLARYHQLGNFANPKLWSEKMQWRILNDRRQILAIASDKLASKRYVSSVVSDQTGVVRIPETLWVGTDPLELYALRDRLPARWVFKPNASSGRVRMLDGSVQEVDWPELLQTGSLWMRPDEQTRALGHWGYGVARRLLIAEARIGDGAGAPADLRAHVFAGKIGRLDWSIGLGTPEHRVACYLPDLLTRLPVGLSYEVPIGIPTPLDALDALQRSQIIAAIEAIADGIDYLRIDGYFHEGRYWFGELTAYTESGLGPITPALDALAGQNWQLPNLAEASHGGRCFEDFSHGPEVGSLQA